MPVNQSLIDLGEEFGSSETKKKTVNKNLLDLGSEFNIPEQKANSQPIQYNQNVLSPNYYSFSGGQSNISSVLPQTPAPQNQPKRNALSLVQPTTETQSPYLDIPLPPDAIRKSNNLIFPSEMLPETINTVDKNGKIVKSVSSTVKSPKFKLISDKTSTWQDKFQQMTGKKATDLGFTNPQDAQDYVTQQAKLDVAGSELPQPASIGQSPEELQKFQDAQNMAGLVNTGENIVNTGYDSLIKGVHEGLQSITSGLKEKNLARAYGKVGVGALETVINTMPIMQVLNFVTPTIDQATREVAKKAGIDENTASMAVQKALPFIFGKWVGTGALTSEAVDYGLDKSGILTGLSKPDQKLVRDLARNAVFFGIAEPNVRTLLTKTVNDAATKFADAAEIGEI